MDFPSKVYRANELKPHGFESLLVRDEKDLSKALADGWFKTVPEALIGEAPARRVRKPKE